MDQYDKNLDLFFTAKEYLISRYQAEYEKILQKYNEEHQLGLKTRELANLNYPTLQEIIDTARTIKNFLIKY